MQLSTAELAYRVDAKMSIGRKYQTHTITSMANESITWKRNKKRAVTLITSRGQLVSGKPLSGVCGLTRTSKQTGNI